MIEIEAPDGSIVEFPDGTPDETITAAMRKAFPPTAAAPSAAPVVGVPFSGARADGGDIMPGDRAYPAAQPARAEPGMFDGGFGLGVRQVGAGLADVAGLPVDLGAAMVNVPKQLAATGINKVAGREVVSTEPVFANPVGGSQWFKDMAGAATEAVTGQEMTPIADMPLADRMGAEAIRMATGALVPGAGMASRARPLPRPSAPRSAQPAPVMRPYSEAMDRATDVRAAPAPGLPSLADEVSRGWQGTAPVIADTAAGAGAGAAVEAARGVDMGDANPVRDLGAAMVGSYVGGRAAQVATAPAATTRAVADRLRDDPGIPLDASGNATSRATAQKGAQFLQDSVAGDPAATARRLRNESAALAESGLPTPTTGILSNDEGLMSVERGYRAGGDPEFARSDRKVQGAAANRVADLQPNDAADMAAPQRAIDQQNAAARKPAQADVTVAQRQVDEARNAGQAGVMRAEQQQAAVDAGTAQRVQGAEGNLRAAKQAEQDVAAPVAARAGDRESASERVATAVANTKEADTARKAGLYRQAEDAGADSRTAAQPFADDARAIRDDIGRLAQPDAKLANIVGDLDKLAPAQRAPSAAEIDAGVPAPAGPAAQVSVKELTEMLPRLSQARDAARAAMRGDTVQRLDRISQGIKGELGRLADSGDAAALKWREAEQNYKTDFAPKYREGVGRELDQAERAGAAVPPTAVAGRFLRSGGGSKEAAQDLKRILSEAKDEASGMQAARDYLAADMARLAGGGTISPKALRSWIDARKGALEETGFLQEAEKLHRDVLNRRQATGDLAQALDRAKAERAGALTQAKQRVKEAESAAKTGEKAAQQELVRAERALADIEASQAKDASAALLDRDWETMPKAAGAIMGGKSPRSEMQALMKRLEGNPEAIEGWKLAVRKHLQERLSNAGRQGTDDGSQSISAAKTNRLSAGEKAAIEVVFGREGVKALDDVQRLLGALERRSVGSTVGSQTAENVNLVQRNVDRALEIGLKVVYGGLSGGNKFRNYKLARDTWGTENSGVAFSDLVARAQFDPLLAAHLLDLPINRSLVPKWNRKLAKLLAGAESVRGEQEDK